MSDGVEHPLSLAGGGPFIGVARRLRLITPRGKAHVGWIVAIAWGPLMLAGAIRVVFGGSVDPLLDDISVHTRLLVALPLFIGAESILGRMSRLAFHELYDRAIVACAALNAIADRVHQLRDGRAVELAIALGAFAVGQLVLWGVLGSTGLVHGSGLTIWSFARIWYSVVALPLVLFLMLRWGWRWLLWVYVLVLLSRRRIAAIATHPDGAAGLDPLRWPLQAFSIYVFALSSILSGAWATQLLDHELTAPQLVPTVCAFLVLVIAVGGGPLLPFSGAIFRARLRALAQYGSLGYDYAAQLQRKWIDGRPDEPLLGSADFQSWHDFADELEQLQNVKIVLFGLRALRNIAIASLVPLVPLIATTWSMTDVVHRFGGLLFG